MKKRQNMVIGVGVTFCLKGPTLCCRTQASTCCCYSATWVVWCGAPVSGRSSYLNSRGIGASSSRVWCLTSCENVRDSLGERKHTFSHFIFISFSFYSFIYFNSLFMSIFYFLVIDLEG